MERERVFKLISLGVPYQEAIEYEIKQGRELHVELVIEDHEVRKVVINGEMIEKQKRKVIKL